MPTAGIMFDAKSKNFMLYINPTIFVDKWNFLERKAVLIHELFHVTFKHVFFDTPEHIDRARLNIAMDLVINQYIKNLPEGCMIISNFKDASGKDFPKNSTTENYYALLENATMKNPDKGNGKGDRLNVSDMIKNGQAPEFDTHDWNMSEEDAKEKLEAVRDLMKRAMQKASNSHTKVPDSIREMLQEIDSKLAKLDYKAILLSTLKKSMPSRDIRKTWKRPSRRLGDIAQGNTIGIMPKIEVLIDTSGSISVEEANEFLKIVDNFLNVGVDKATIHLFHTSVYHSQRVKRNCKVEKDTFQSGGTDLTEAFSKVIKSKPDLVIVLTDGYWSMPEVNLKKIPQSVFVISKDGTVDHPMKKMGKTVKYG
jgi:predicted metal-dependent peptidase